MSRPIDEALEACLAAIEADTPAAEVLARWPDPAEREALAPLVQGAAFLGDLPPMDAARRAAIQAELVRVGLSLYPAPAGGLLAQLPHAPLLLAALAGAALLVWLAVARWPEAGVPKDQPRPATTSIPSTQSTQSTQSTPTQAKASQQAPDTPGPSSQPGPAGQPSIDEIANSTTHAVTPSADLTSSPSSGTPARTATTPPPAFPSQPSTSGESPLLQNEAGAGVDLTGTVTNPTGRPIAGAEVSAYRLGSPGFYVQRTEADGGYRLRLRPGSYVFQANADGYIARWYAGTTRRADATAVEVAPDRPASEIDFTLEPAHNTSHDLSPDSAGTPARAAGLTLQGGHP